MAKNEKYMNSEKEVKEMETSKDMILNIENDTAKAEIKKEKPAGQQYKVYSIVSDKAVMAKGLKDNKWYSKPNKNYKIGQIISD